MGIKQHLSERIDESMAPVGMMSGRMALEPGFCWTKLVHLGKEMEIDKRVEVVDPGGCAGQEGSKDRKGW